MSGVHWESQPGSVGAVHSFSSQFDTVEVTVQKMLLSGGVPIRQTGNNKLKEHAKDVKTYYISF